MLFACKNMLDHSSTFHSFTLYYYDNNNYRRYRFIFMINNACKKKKIEALYFVDFFIF